MDEFDLQTQITPLKTLTSLRDSCSIKVRIIRLWKLPLFQDPKKSFSIEMIFVDESGTRIQATVKKDIIYKFDRLLKEGAICIISNFGIASNSAKIKFVDNTNKISFYGKTKVTLCKNFDGPLFGFKFVEFNSVLNLENPSDVTFDLIGDVVAFGEIENKIDDDGNLKQRLDIELEDLETFKLKVTLWGEYATKMYSFLNDPSRTGHPIVVIQFLKVKVFRDRPYISNTYYGTKLFMNENIEEINDFKSSLMAKLGDDASTHRLTQLEKKVPYSMYNDFVVLNGKRNIDELRDTNEIITCVVIGTIKHIQNDLPWYYMGCRKCTKIVDIIVPVEDGGEDGSPAKEIYLCNTCPDKVINADPRLQVRVQDGTGCATFTLFDHIASVLLGSSATALVNSYGDDVDTRVVPKEFNVLLERTFAFKVSKKPYNLKHNSHVYTVSNLSDDEKILQALIQKTEVDQPEKSESVSLIDMDYVAKDKPISKDAISCTGDNSTPTTIEKSTASSPNLKLSYERSTATSPDFKRKLEDSYAEDVIADMSTTKKAKTPPFENRGFTYTRKDKLIVPKLEK